MNTAAEADLQIEHDRILKRRQQLYAVIDIGSNSIRLVVYDDLSRSPFPRFNEKSLCVLGASIDDAGNLSAEAIERAADAVRRFVAIARAMGVGQIDGIATEAVRRARNGEVLLDKIRQHTGLETRVLTGEEEATYSALGVVSGIHRPKGLVGDIGGGSLEVAEVIGTGAGERKCSMPLGALPVRARMIEDAGAARRFVDKTLNDNLPPLLTDPVFYAIGGGWRALARIHIAKTSAPIRVVHGYEMSAAELRTLAKAIVRMTREQVAALPDVPTRRVDTLPASALVMSRLLKILKPERVVFSALGLREGWLYSRLPEDEKVRDALVEGAQTFALPTSRVPEFSAALVRWTDHLFPGETPEDRRLRLAVCALTDMSWRDHPKVRAVESYQRILQFPFVGLSHAERAFIAVALMARYDGRPDKTIQSQIGTLLGHNQLKRAEILGRALLLGHRFSGSVPDILHKSTLRIDADAVRLEVSDAHVAPDSDAVQNRLRQLAKVTGVDGAEILTC